MKIRAALSLALALNACAPVSPDGEAENSADALLYDGVTALPITATLAFNQCVDSELGTCGARGSFVRSSRSATVTFGSSNPLRKVLPGARVHVGPFRLTRSVRNLTSGTVDASTTYRIRILARSPAAYASSPTGAAFLGATANLTVIGSRDVVISALSAQQDVYVDATLPSVFTSLQVVGEVGPSATTTYARTPWPSNCASLPGSLPSGTDVTATSTNLDAACFQAVVAPTGLLQPRYLPVSIIYEPPGDCSWSNLTQQNIAGSLHAVTQQADTLTTTTRDVGFFWNRSSTRSESESMNASERAVQFRILDTASAGTRLGLPLESPGDPRCNMPGTAIPTRVDAGPGRGDVFFFVQNPQLLTWSTGGGSNTTVLPSSALSILQASAYQIATGIGLPSNIQFTDAEKRSLLALDPYVNAADPFVRDSAGRVIDVRVVTNPTLDARRFANMNLTISLGAGLSADQSTTSEFRLSSGQTLSDATRSFVNSSPDNPTTQFLSDGVQSAVVDLAGAAANLVPVPGFGAIAGQILDSLLPLYTNRTTVSTVSTLRGIRRSEVSNTTGVSQRFHLQNTTQGMTVGIYFDRVFGTHLVYRLY